MFNKYLSSTYYEPADVLGVGDAAVNETDKTATILSLHPSDGRTVIQILSDIPRRVGARGHPCPPGFPTLPGTSCPPTPRCEGPRGPPAAGGIGQQLWQGRSGALDVGRPSWGSSCRSPGQRGGATGLSVHLQAWRWSRGGWVQSRNSSSDAPPRQTSSRRALEHYFHAVVAAVEQMASEPSPSREGHLERLEEIYCSLLGPAAAARGRCGGKRQARRAAVRVPCRGRQRPALYLLRVCARG